VRTSSWFSQEEWATSVALTTPSTSTGTLASKRTTQLSSKTNSVGRRTAIGQCVPTAATLRLSAADARLLLASMMSTSSKRWSKNSLKITQSTNARSLRLAQATEARWSPTWPGKVPTSLELSCPFMACPAWVRFGSHTKLAKCRFCSSMTARTPPFQSSEVSTTQATSAKQ